MTLTWKRERAGVYYVLLTDRTKLQIEKRAAGGWEIYHYTGSTAAPSKGGNTYCGVNSRLDWAKETAAEVYTQLNSPTRYLSIAHRHLDDAAYALANAQQAGGYSPEVRALFDTVEELRRRSKRLALSAVDNSLQPVV